METGLSGTGSWAPGGRRARGGGHTGSVGFSSLPIPPGAWIITGGTHTGVMKQVGEAVHNFSLSSSYNKGEVVTIGIATWGTVHNRDGLVHPTVSAWPESGRGRAQSRWHVGSYGDGSGHQGQCRTEGRGWTGTQQSWAQVPTPQVLVTQDT